MQREGTTDEFHKLYPPEHVEHPLDGETSDTQKRFREIVELRLTLLAPVLLSVFSRRSPLEDRIAPLKDT